MLLRFFILLTAGLLSGCLLFSQNFHSLSFRTIGGDTIETRKFAGSKVLVVILPLDQKDSVYDQFTTFCKRVGTELVVIGIPSIEQGFVKSQGRSLQGMYDNPNIIIAEGMNSRKTSKAAQSLLAQWLTDSKQNKRFDRDAVEAGSKYFINESGNLFAVFSRQTSFQHPVIEQVIKTRASNKAK